MSEKQYLANNRLDDGNDGVANPPEDDSETVKGTQKRESDKYIFGEASLDKLQARLETRDYRTAEGVFYDKPTLTGRQECSTLLNDYLDKNVVYGSFIAENDRAYPSFKSFKLCKNKRALPRDS